MSRNEKLDEQARATQGTTTANTEQVDQLIDEFGNRVLVLMRHNRLPAWMSRFILAYVESLLIGDGTRPAHIVPRIASQIDDIFVELCATMKIERDALPGQRQDWYRVALGRYRNKSKETSKGPR